MFARAISFLEDLIPFAKIAVLVVFVHYFYTSAVREVKLFGLGV